MCTASRAAISNLVLDVPFYILVEMPLHVKYVKYELFVCSNAKEE